MEVNDVGWHRKPGACCDAADRLAALVSEVKRIMTQVSDAPILEQLQEAIDVAEAVA